MDNDVTTTANLDLTLLSDMMNQAVETCRSRHVPLPKNLRVHADNATSETRNQTALKWGAVMAYRSMFSQVAFTYYAVGHSHGLPDQRFSEVRGKLCSESVLQTPEDFLSAVKKMQAPSSRVLRAERCSSLFDFKALMGTVAGRCLGTRLHSQPACEQCGNCAQLHFDDSGNILFLS